MLKYPRPLFSRSLLGLGFGLAAACSSGGTEQNPQPQPNPAQADFESDNPGGAQRSSDQATDNGAVAEGPQAGEPAPTAPEDGESDDGDVGRAIEEADIIKLEGSRLFALSQYGGLSVIDVSQRDELKLLGRHKVLATPFEMYVRDDVALVLYNGYGEYEELDDGSYNYHQTSYVVVLDTSDAASITELGRFAVPGYINDSRLVGNALYVAAYQDGYCWNCATEPRTNLLSLNVSDPRDIRQVDELSFAEREDSYSWKRSLSSTDTRMYVAGPTWGANEPVGSTIQVIDISDPSGDMEAGAEVQVAGQIESRWQMDEFNGVLRVVSQPFAWRTDEPPVVQTFSIESSTQLQALGSLNMVLPRPERLMSVRFDAERAYAITAERTDPLFTLDLSDPANPVQRGELEIPGWVYHMEPRGDRVLGLGYDQGNAEGGLTVSLFDVSDMDAPSMLDRVNFGGSWGWLAEDQDRIHKAFRVLDDEGLVLVPFSGSSEVHTDDASCSSTQYMSGVQLVDYTQDDLELRGVAASVGQARRGFLHDERLFTVSDDRVQTFDIADRSAPVETQSLSLALKVDQSAIVGEHVVRLGQDWYSSVPQVDVTKLNAAGSPDALARLALPELQQQSCVDGKYSYSYFERVVAGETAAHFIYRTYSYETVEGGKEQSASRIITMDLRDPNAPVVTGDAQLDFAPSYGYGYAYGVFDNGSPVLNVGTALAFAQHRYEYTENGQQAKVFSSVELVDLADPAAPVVSSVALPQHVGATNLFKSGNLIALSHFEQSASNPEKVRFYLNRIDVSDVRNPVALPKVNVPGSLLAFDAAANRAVTLDYRTNTSTGVTAQQCNEVLGGSFSAPDNAGYDYQTTPGNCETITHIVYLLSINDEHRASVLSKQELAENESVSSAALGEDRLFLALGSRAYYGYPVDIAEPAIGVGGLPYRGFSSGVAKLGVVSGLGSGDFDFTTLELETGDQYSGGIQRLAASGERAVVATGWQGKLSVVDASDMGDVKVVRDVDVTGYVSDLDLHSGVAVVSMGYDGAMSIPVDD